MWWTLGLLLMGCGAEAPTREHVPETDVVRVQANGITHAVIQEGEGPLVILLHGFPDTAHTWDDVRPEIAAAGFTAVSPFLRGYTPTEVPDQDVDHETLARDVLGLMDAYGAESAILVAHDWGAVAAYATAHLAPERVEHLVAVAITPPGTLKSSLSLAWSGRHFFRLRRDSAVPLMQRNDFAHVDTLYGRWAPSWDVPAAELEPVKNTFAMEASLDAALGYYRGIGLDESFFDEPIHVPVTLIGGREDLVPETAFTVDAAQGVDGPFTVHMLDGGHFPHRESPEAFKEVVLEVLRSR